MSPHLIDDFVDSNPAYQNGNGNGMNGAYRNEHAVQPVNGANGTNGAAANGSNGINANGHTRLHSKIAPASPESVHDLLCVGFGPASLAIAVALHDSLDSGSLPSDPQPKVLFLEKQPRFAWHAGMLLPGAKMQISFIKDMATLRDPRSHFTFLNYLHKAGRLVEFTNLSTFLPSRVEYEDYLRWCAGHFDNVVRYGQEVVAVSPEKTEAGSVRTFVVVSKDERGTISTHRAKNVILAIGGQASIPKCLPQKHPRIVHSSRYAYLAPKILSDPAAPYRVAVVGAGQSAAEIFNNIQILYPNSRTTLIMRQEFLRPSDDSPFINSIFNPEFVDNIYPRPSQQRRSLLSEARATNYGVVRLELIEQLYERMYDQRRELGPDESKWQHRILACNEVVGVNESLNLKESLKLRVRPINADEFSREEILDVDLIVVATGYKRDAHLDILKDAWGMLPNVQSGAVQSGVRDGWEVATEDGTKKSVQVSRSYRVQFAPGKLADGSGVWLQGCCEGTHGISDTLLSVLATRSGEIVDSIFGAGSK